MLFLGEFEAPLGLDRVDDSVNSVLGHLKWNSLNFLTSSFPWSLIYILLIFIELPRYGVTVAHVLAITYHLLPKRTHRLSVVLVL